MTKSVFFKYFTAIALIVSCTFFLLAVTQTFVAGRYWISEKKALLTENADTVAVFLADSTMEGPGNSYFLPNSLSPVLRQLASVAEGSVLVTDTEFRVLLCSDNGHCSHIGHTLPSSVREGLSDGNFFTMGRLDDLYEDNQYTAGVAMIKDGTVMGYVLVSSSTKNLQAYIGNTFRLSLLSGIAVLLLVFVILYIFTYRMVRPLKQMAAVTRRFSHGDFSARVYVKGQDEMAELAGALNGMAISLSSEEDARRSFVANISHELKTPMTTISGFIDGISDGTIPPEKHDHYLRIVTDEVKRLSRLVHAMLNLSRIDSGKLQLRPVNFDLTETVCTALLTFEQPIEKKNISIEGLEDCKSYTVSGDYDLVQQAVYNLLENAVKFTDEGGFIRIHLFREGGRTFCCIRNSGAGIPPTELPHIFERFYKSDRSRSLDKSGTGLGLFLVKTILDLHNGEITVRSVENSYCEFTFWLPD